MGKKLFIEEVDIKNKKVLVRVDYNVPIDAEGNILDDSRIIESLKTIRYIVQKESKPILITHLGRPTAQEEKFKLNKVAQRLQALLKDDNIVVKKIDEVFSSAVEKILKKAKVAEVYLLENLRFFKEEENNDENFAKNLSSLAEIFVNEAFSASHRHHASIIGIPKFILSCFGYNFKKEIDNLSKVAKEYIPPFYALIGGAKISDKLGILTNLIDKCDKVFLGGALPFTILKANGVEVGHSYIEPNFIQKAREIYEHSKMVGKEIVIPKDFIYVKSVEEDGVIKISDNSIPEGNIGVDIGPKSTEYIMRAIKDAKTILWAGPFGIYEKNKYAGSCKILLETLLGNGGFKVGCGGDTYSMAKKLGYLNSFTYISTSGGAALDFIAKGTLPGYEVLTNA